MNVTFKTNLYSKRQFVNRLY